MVWNRLGLRGRFSVVFALILILSIGAFSALAYDRARQTTIDATYVRIRSASQQFAQLAVRGLTDRLASVETVARSPAVVARLDRGGDSLRATAALAPLGPDTGLTVAVEIRDVAGRPVAALGQAVAARGPVPDSAVIGPLFREGDAPLFEISAPVRVRGRVIGGVVVVRSVATSSTANQRLAELMGANANLLVGNRDGSVWTNLAHFVDRPPPAFAGTRYQRDGLVRLAGSAPVPGTPLVFGVEIPLDAVLAETEALLISLVSIGALIVLLGILLAWSLGGTITRPLLQLTSATERIAAGDLSAVPLLQDQGSEIGRLSRSFSAMAESVRKGRDTLEQQVHQRTAELEQALQQLEAAQEVLLRNERLAALGTLAGGVGHELRNPLGVMSNALYYLEMTQPDAPPKVREYHQLVRTQIRRAEKIVRDLLDFARVRPPERSRVPIAAFLEDQLQRVEIPDTIEVKTEVPGNLPHPEIDQEQVGQVVLNLVTNAVQAMADAGGTLTIRASANNGTVKLEVVDSGPGVAPTDLERVFEPLYTTKARGIGLGLSISRILARSNGGDLKATSVPGHGATFVLELPVTG